MWMTNVTDITGSLRIKGAVVDRGAYESSGAGAGSLQCNFVGTPLEGVDSLSVIFTSSIAGSNTNGVVYRWDFDGNGSFEKQGTFLSCVTNIYGIGYYTVRLVVSNAAGEVAEKIKSSYVHVSPGIIYVATNGLNGMATNWVTAKTNIQDAIDEAISNNQILVAGHIFRIPSTILLSNKKGVRIQGGYAATNAVGPGRCDPKLWPTIIYPKNSGYRAIIISSAEDCGISNIVFYGASSSLDGGALYIVNSSGLRLYGCVISNNYTSAGINLYRYGGGIYGSGGNVVVERCIIRQNTAHAAAPAWNGGCYGGGIYIAGGNWVIKESIFLYNTANGQSNQGGYGGAIYTGGGTVLIKNCLICSNRTISIGWHGGGIYSSAGTIIENCTVAGNSVSSASAQGGGLYIAGGSATNCIFYQNKRAGVDDNVGGNVSSIKYSSAIDLVHGINGNITNQVLFQDMVYYHLKSRAGVYLDGYFDGGRWGISTENSRGIDEGSPNMPYSREPYPHGFRVNMGMYGNTPVASKSFITASIIFIR